MELIDILLIVVHVIMAILLVIAILLQSGKGGGLGAGFGGASAAATQIFGGRGAGNFLSRSTVAFAAIFMCTSLGLAMRSATPRTVLDLTETSGAVSSQEDTILEEGTGPELDLDAIPDPEPSDEEDGAVPPTPADAPAVGDTPAEGTGSELKLDIPDVLEPVDAVKEEAKKEEVKAPNAEPVKKPDLKTPDRNADPSGEADEKAVKKVAEEVEKKEAKPKAKAPDTTSDDKPTDPKEPSVKEAQ